MDRISASQRIWIKVSGSLRPIKEECRAVLHRRVESGSVSADFAEYCTTHDSQRARFFAKVYRHGRLMVAHSFQTLLPPRPSSCS